MPRKNIRDLGGYPLIAWTIRTAHYAVLLDKVVVSSDDAEILAVARENGAKTLVRPDWMAEDDVSPYPGILHAIDAQKTTYSHVCLLQPTSPFRAPLDIDRCIVYGRHEAAIVSSEEGKKVPNGAIYVGRIDWLRDMLAMGEKAPFDSPAVARYPMPPCRSIDIDTPEDFAEAEAQVERWVA